MISLTHSLGKEISSFPSVAHLGDLLFCINVEINYYYDMKQLVGKLTKSSGVIAVHRKSNPITGEESAYRNNPLSASGLSYDEWEVQTSSHRIRVVDWVSLSVVNNAYDWVRAQFRSSRLSSPTEGQSTLSSIASTKAFFLQHRAQSEGAAAQALSMRQTHDIVCCVVHKEVREQGVWRLYLWDATNLVEDVDPGLFMNPAETTAAVDAIRQSLLASLSYSNLQNKEVPEPLTLLGGIAAADYLVPSEVRVIERIGTGSWLRIRNVHVSDSAESGAALLEIQKDTFLAIVSPTFRYHFHHVSATA